MSDFFVDRIELKQNLFELLNDVQLQNTVYILSSRSGLGKSEFCNQIIKNVCDKYPSVKISIPIGENISLDEGFYIREIARTISEQSKNYNYESLDEFIHNTDNSVITKIKAHKLAEESEELHKLVKPIHSIVSYFDNTGSFSEENLLNISDSRYIYIILNEYILHCCDLSSKVVINIENIQQIDILSLTQIKELLKKANNIFLLLEYTSRNDSLNEAKRFETNFHVGYTKVETRRLEKLGYEYTCELINYICPNKNIMNEETLREIYVTIDGNIRQLSDIENVFEISDKDTSINTQENFTLQRLKGMNNAHQIQLLCLVYAHMSQVPNEILKLLLSGKEYVLFLNYESILSELMGDSGLLEFDSVSNTIKLKHDSIRMEMKKIPRYEVKIALSFSWWIDFYEKELKKAGKNDWRNIKEIVKKLCYFYCYYEPAAGKILSVLPHIRMIAINSINPDEAISFLIGFYDTFKKLNDPEQLYTLEKFLLNIYYELGIFDKAYSVFKNISFRSVKTYNLYKAMLLDRLQQESEAIKIVDMELAKTSDRRYELSLYMIKMIAAASINQYDECTKIFEYIYNNKDIYSKYFEYGFFLRNSEIVLSLRDAIPYLKESIQFFQNRNEKIYEAHTRISLLMNCARAGLFDEAREQLGIIKTAPKNNSLERHIILNDEAALEMCRGNYNKALEDELKLAMCTAQVVFDKIIINHNLLILYKKNEQMAEGRQVVEYLLELLGSETNRLNVCFTYWNISFFYKGYDDIQYTYYYNKYITLYRELTSRPIRKSVIETDVAHKPNMEYVIGFISHWRFPIPEEL